ncbi:MAG TPA: L-seryl-tRNA(Sec) selenium transferase [Terriglobales bacterium]|nr:L-seryl-tRNA(Sec) selenium transferase [Terriglobales bacterium]
MPPAPESLRRLPGVDELLRREDLADLWQRLGPDGSRRVIREVLEAARAAAMPADLDAELHAAAAHRLSSSLRPVINATGVVLHTNLGRAPLAGAAVKQLAAVAAAYTNLELNLDTGERGRRDLHLARLLAELTGAEQTIVVNNNAAAVLLAIHTLAIEPQGEILVSRGELVEIGESFRIPDIIARGGAKLVEVGATNRTRIGDYERALTPATRVILRVHRSNFTQEGFVSQPSLAELSALARRANVPLVEDLGSGSLARIPGLPPEPTVAESIAQGVDIVTYSGDKLLGGPQAGLISGGARWVAALRANPLFRALRVDRLTYAALEATLGILARQAWDELPALAMLRADNIEARARDFAAQVPPGFEVEIAPGESLIGGGARPGDRLPTWLIGLARPGRSAAALARALRQYEPPIIARLAHDRCWLDLRTVLPGQEDELRAGLRAIM